MPTVSVAGAAVDYTVIGSGPGLVLVAGTGLDAMTNYGHLAPGLSQGRAVILPDYAGSGRTVDPAGPLTVTMLAEQVAAVAEVAEGPVDLLGFSLGAVIAAAVAGLRPDLVGRLVLVAGWPGPDDARMRLSFEVWQRLERVDHDLFTRFLQLACFSAPFLSELGEQGVLRLVDGAPPITDGMRRHIELDGRADVRDLLPKIAAPTLVVGLTQDQVVPVEQTRRLHEAIAGSRFVEIDSGHLVVFERPEELVAVVHSFLKE